MNLYSATTGHGWSAVEAHEGARSIEGVRGVERVRNSFCPLFLDSGKSAVLTEGAMDGGMSGEHLSMNENQYRESSTAETTLLIPPEQ